MERSNDLLLKRINDNTGQAAGLVSVIKQNDRIYIKIRIWDLLEGSYLIYVGNNAENIFKQITQFDFLKPYVNFEYPVEMTDFDSVFVTKKNKSVVLSNVPENIEGFNAFLASIESPYKEPVVNNEVQSVQEVEVLQEEAQEEAQEDVQPLVEQQDVDTKQEVDQLQDNPYDTQDEDIPSSDNIPRPPVLSNVWDEELRDETPAPVNQEGKNEELPELPLDLEMFKQKYGDAEFEKDRYIQSLDRNFEQFVPFANGREDYVWWRAENPVTLHELMIGNGVKINDFFNANAMMSFFKFGFFAAGIYEDEEGELLLVFGIPSALNSEQQAFPGYSVWVRDNGRINNVEGYWLVYYDPQSEELLSWDS